MRVLDIDLDFFLSDTCPFADPDCRPDPACAQPWDEGDVKRFLEKNLLLSQTAPIPGRVFETHDGALFFWRDLMKAGLLTAPFHITHVDAHTDLGVAQHGYPFVRHSVLCRPVQGRCDIEAYHANAQLNEANYLVFALAMRWVSSMDNLRIPASKPDMPEDIITLARNELHLESAFPALFETRYGQEPFVPYAEFPDGRNFVSPAPYDFVSLAISPRYAPSTADRLIPVFRSFMRPF